MKTRLALLFIALSLVFPALVHADDGLPIAVDLSPWTPPIGTQADGKNCTEWAAGYSLYGWYMRKRGAYPPGGFSPGFLYSQVPRDRWGGTEMNDALWMLQYHGIVPRRDYPQGDPGLTSPTKAQVRLARRYRIAGYTLAQGPGLAATIKADLAGGTPVALSIPFYTYMATLTPTDFAVDRVGQYSGNHAVVADGYDSYGVWVASSWGERWGYHGRAELSWAWVNQRVLEAATITL